MILDLFAGPGGWDEGLRLLGSTTPVLGVEHDPQTAAVAVAAGHPRIVDDVRNVATIDVPCETLAGLIASPPCQTFTLASRVQQGGNYTARASIPQLAAALRLVAVGKPVDEAAEANGLVAGDPRSTLVLEPMRFIRDLAPTWVAMENVPGVLPVWQQYAELLAELGWVGTWAGTLNAADYGLPQKRRRAFLLAHRTRPVQPPAPTHADPHKKGGTKGLQPWVTMAEALGLGERPSDLTAWAWDRPSTTVVRSFCPEVVSAPGYRKKGDPPRQRTPGSITCTHDQLMVLQGLRPDFPIAGSNTKRGSIIGAALPPPWAAALLGVLL